MFTKIIIKNSIKGIVRSDAKYFDDKIMSKGEYFNGEIASKDPSILHKLNLNIENVKKVEINEIDNMNFQTPNERSVVPVPTGALKNDDDFAIIKNDINKVKNSVDIDIKNYIMFKNNLNISDLSVNRTHLSSDQIVDEFMVMRNRPHRKIWAMDPNHIVTLKDYEELSPQQALIYDRRSFLALYIDLLLDDHILLCVFFKKSLIDPIWVRIIFLVFNLSIIFAMNALFFTDDLIEARADVPEEERVNILI